MLRRGFVVLLLSALGAACGEVGASGGGACTVDDRYCYDDRTAATCMQIGKSEGDVLYTSDRTCAARGFTKRCDATERSFSDCADAE